MHGEKNSRKSKQRNKCRNSNRFKKLKVKIFKKEEKNRKKENTELQKPNIDAVVYNNNNKLTEEKRKSSEAELYFLVPIKSTT